MNARNLPFPPPEPSRLKLWSVLVTIFGDLLGAPDREISGPTLAALVQGMGFQHEALRVALHRLRRDGWIASRKQGRIAHYRMTGRAAAETDAVRVRVYGSTGQWRRALRMGPPWAIVIGAEPQGPAFGLGREAWLAPPGEVTSGRARARVTDIVLSQEALAEAAQAARAHEHAALAEQVRQVLSAADWLASAPLVERTLQRIAVLHPWRRLTLLSNPVAEVLLGPDSAPERCRKTVREVLSALPPPDVAALEAAVAEMA